MIPANVHPWCPWDIESGLPLVWANSDHASRLRPSMLIFPAPANSHWRPSTPTTVAGHLSIAHAFVGEQYATLYLADDGDLIASALTDMPDCTF